MSNEEIKLPQKPEPDHALDCGSQPFFNADQMNAHYALGYKDGLAARPVAEAGEVVAYITGDSRMLVFADKVQQPTTMTPLYRAAPSARTLDLDLLKRCLSAMRHAVSYGETGRGRPPQQTCLLEIKELEAILAATSAPAEAPSVRQNVCAEMRALCSSCGGTGDISTITGDHVGKCDCPASAWSREAPSVRDQALEEAALTCEQVQEEFQRRDSGKWPELRADGDEGASACADAIRALQGKPEVASTNKHLPGWERGIATVTMNGHQLREALDFINPDGDDDLDQRDNDLTFGIVQHQDDGKAATGLCCWNDDTDGVLPLDGKPEAPKGGAK